METKPAIKSKTIDFNALMIGIVAILSIFDIELSKGLYTAILAAVPLLNIILRFVTKDAITLTGADAGGSKSGCAKFSAIAAIAAICVAISVAGFIGCAPQQSATQQISAQTSDPAKIALATFVDAQDAYIDAQELYMPYQQAMLAKNPALHAQIIAYFTAANKILIQWELMGDVPVGDKATFRDYIRRISIQAAQALENQ